MKPKVWSIPQNLWYDIATLDQTSDHFFLFVEIFISPKISSSSYMMVTRQDIIEKVSAAEFVSPRNSTVECSHCSGIIDLIIFHDASSFFDQYVKPLLTSQNWRIQQFVPGAK